MELNENQKQVVETLSGNIAVIASAGSGKTSVLTLRVKNLVDNGVNPNSILAITFSKKAKETLTERIEKLLPDVYSLIQIETFHSFAFKIIKKKYPYLQLWNKQWEKEKILKQIVYDLGLYRKNNFPYNEIMSFISLQKNLMIKPEDELIASEDMPFDLYTMKKIFSKFEKHKADNGLAEFDDFLNMAVEILQNNENILNEMRKSIRYILADEYQDISVSQAVLLKMLNDDNTMIVGDPLQAIYSFRGGDSRFIMNFDTDYRDVKVIHLNTNYRCGKDIVDLANTFAQSVPDSKHHNYAESIAAQGNVPVPIVKNYPTDTLEAEHIAHTILKKKYTFSDVAILSRTNAQLQKIQNRLHKNEIPFEVVNGSLFIDQKEIKILISYLLLAYDTENDEAFTYIWNKPNRFLPNAFLDEIGNYSIKNKMSMFDASMILARKNRRYLNSVSEIHEVIHTLQSGDFDDSGDMIGYIRKRLSVDYFVSKGVVGEDGGSCEQSENMDSFQDMCKSKKSLKQFSDYIDSFNKPKEVSNKDRVKLLTLHKSKGLEFPIVFIIGCNEGLLPHGKADNIDDERRLMYVGITRAERELYLSYVSEYNNNETEASRFIKEFRDSVNIVKSEEQKENEE